MNFASSLPKQPVGSPSYYFSWRAVKNKTATSDAGRTRHYKWAECHSVCPPRNSKCWYFSRSLSVSIKPAINRWLFRCLPTACFDNILCFTLSSSRLREDSRRLVLVFQDGPYSESISELCVIKTHSSCCNCSLFTASCQLPVAMQTPVSLYKSHSGIIGDCQTALYTLPVSEEPADNVPWIPTDIAILLQLQGWKETCWGWYSLFGF